MEKHKLPNGETIFCINKHEVEFLYSEIYQDKVYTSGGISLKEDSVVVDAGANIGLFTIYVLEKFPKSSVYAFEPSPETFKVLKENTKKYSSRCKIFEVGLSNKEEEAKFHFYPNFSTFSTFYPDHLSMGGDKSRMENVVDSKSAEAALVPKEEICKLVTLSSIIEKEKIKQIDLLKMDVQRAELYVLEGIKDNDWVKIKQIAFELHHIGEEETKKIDQLLSQKGYRVEKHEDKLSTKEVPIYMVYAFRK